MNPEDGVNGDVPSRQYSRTVPRFSLDSSARLAGERVLIGGSPLRIFRLTDAGAAVVRAIAVGEVVPSGHEPLTTRLLEAGAIHPLAGSTSPISAADVSVVIPAFQCDISATVSACVESGVHRVIVVDDASPSPISVDRRATVELLRLETNGGPGAARNAGLAIVRTPFVAFVDADATPDPRWLEELLWLFDDDRVGLVAPRVAAGSGATILDRYELWRSPLDLGDEPALVRAGSRVGYVPAAAIVVRASAIRAIGGFDETLRFGEDVDLVWRLDEAGYRCRYDPAAHVTHHVRPTLGAWIRQRVGYGSSAASLDRRHPGDVAPTNTSRWSAVVWALTAAGHPVAGIGVAVGTVAALSRKLDRLPNPSAEAARLAGRGNLFAGRLFASAIVRAWWPIAVPLAVVSRRVRRVLIAAAIAPALYDWLTQRPDLDPLTAVSLRIADDMAYGAGVWKGMVREHRWGPIVPAFTELTGSTWTARLRSRHRLHQSAQAGRG